MPSPAPTLHQVSHHPPSVPVGPGINLSDTTQLPHTPDPSSGMAAPTAPGQPPSLVRQAWNLARSLADFVADGCRTVTADEYRARLEICDACDHRRHNRCMKCGCRLSLKAQGRAFKCPEAKWPQLESRL